MTSAWSHPSPRRYAAPASVPWPRTASCRQPAAWRAAGDSLVDPLPTPSPHRGRGLLGGTVLGAASSPDLSGDGGIPAHRPRLRRLPLSSRERGLGGEVPRRSLSLERKGELGVRSAGGLGQTIRRRRCADR